ncbi:TonB-dependent receptor [Emticicia sp. C21]|uniref:TonB-dependent receptor n=1 Tax=Emticicia sp. C21 TaxID=2302915 RepID=UPI000E34BD5D|nr:TonB-dependent receptor [Emticicia sp. C21]RFS17774.1 TonB-dependent siderophore receptor [Emticicia sp. C21]
MKKTARKLKAILLMALSLVSMLANAQNQTGSIRGTVKTSDGQVAEFVNVGLKGTNKGVASNKSGGFEIKNVAPGTYTLRIFFVGLETKEQSVEVKAGEVTQVGEIILNENATQLQEVVIKSGTTRFMNKESEIVAKMPLKYIENPQVYNTVSSELMKQQAVTNYDDAMRNVPGISRTWESTGRAGDGASYFALRGFEAQTVLYNGLPGLTNGNLDPANIEEIQVIKGPSGTLFGGSFYAYGGMINTITKKPYFTFGGEVAYNAGSYGLNRITADINTPLSKTEKIAMRINTAFHNEGSWQDAGFKKSYFIAPSLLYQVNDRLTFNFLAEILEEERAVPPVFFHSNRADPLTFKTVKDLNLRYDLSFTSNDLSIRNPRFNMQGQMTYKLSDKWTSQSVIARGSSKSAGYYGYIYGNKAGDNRFAQYFTNEQYTINTTDIQQNFNGDFKLGNMRNRVVLGLDYLTRNTVNNASGYALARYVTPQGEASFTDPETEEAIPQSSLTRSSIDQLLANSGINGWQTLTESNTFSIYASDVLNITPKLSAMFSLRADYFDTKADKTTPDDDYNQWALSPKFGLVYQPVLDKVSIFANFMDGFVNVAPATVADPDGSNPKVKAFKPEHSTQWEVGVKTNLISDKLYATVSYYDIKVRNKVTSDPTNINNQLQGGEVGSKGFELDITASPVLGLNLVAGYSHNETKVIKGEPDNFYLQPGRAPGGQGPQDNANFWANYKFKPQNPNGFGIGLGLNYGGEYKVIDNAATGVFTLPSYTLLNGSLFYSAPKYRIGLNVNNITNTQYYIGYWSINPQKPRTAVASFIYKF